MAKQAKKSIKDQIRVRDVRRFLSLGFRDYLAARVLLNSGLILQGAILASTSIEKYFKAIVAFHGGTRRGHLCAKLVSAVSNYDHAFISSCSSEFLRFLEKCYCLRYLDDIESNFNLAFSGKEVLAELDWTVARMESKIALWKQDGDALLRRYQEMALQGDARLLNNNHVLANIGKPEFLSESDLVYEMRLDPVCGLLEAEYRIKKSPTDGSFRREGYAPLGKKNPGEVSYQLALAVGNLLIEEGGDSPVQFIASGDA